ncbi:3-isopropylmalate dehydrogenase [candidate division KSB1 bacterium]|nr:3-isopropylmalate dehydrogenase [candidate division KSB1 bacterium]
MYKLIVLPGDGIGPEVIVEAVKVLQAVEQKFDLRFEIEEHLAGGACLDVHGVPITDETVSCCKETGIVLLGAVGGPKWDDYPLEQRPEKALMRLRRELEVFTNLRPVTVYDRLRNYSPVKPELLKGVDILIVRELTGGLYFGEPKKIEKWNNEERAVDTMVYTTSEIERVSVAAFEAAQKRKKKVMSVDKSNVLATSKLWRKVVIDVASHYPDIELQHMLVDNCAMQLILNPSGFDVILTENTFGDILSDEASVFAGSLGMLPSASLGIGKGMFEPVHGSAPDIMGKGKANPVGAIKSLAMMLRHSFGEDSAANSIENAVSDVINAGYVTADLTAEGLKLQSTSEMGDRIVDQILTS